MRRTTILKNPAIWVTVAWAIFVACLVWALIAGATEAEAGRITPPAGSQITYTPSETKAGSLFLVGDPAEFFINSEGDLVWDRTPDGWDPDLPPIKFEKSGDHYENEDGVKIAIDSSGAMIEYTGASPTPSTMKSVGTAVVQSP